MNTSPLYQSLLQGLARRPIDSATLPAYCVAPRETPSATEQGHNIDPLSVMTLFVQAESFRMPATPEHFDTIAPYHSSGAIVPQALRPDIIHLVGNTVGRATDSAAIALAHHLSRLGRTLHPFDGPKLRTFRQRFRAVLNEPGLEAQDPLSLLLTENGAIDTTLLAEASHAHRLSFLEALRHRDPAQARALIAAQLPLEKADARLELVSLLWIALSGDDKPLLESIRTDRSGPVRQESERILGHLPGSAYAEAQLTDFASRVTVSKNGLLRRRITVSLQLPADIASKRLAGGFSHFMLNWVAMACDVLSIRTLAAQLALSEQDLVTAASDDLALMYCLGIAAANDRNWTLLSLIASCAREPIWPFLVRYGFDKPGLRSSVDRLDYVAAITEKPLPVWDEVHSYQFQNLASAIETLADALGMPLPEKQASILTDAVLSASRAQENTLVACTVLTPVEQIGPLKRRMIDLHPDQSRRAVLLADILIKLYQEKTPS